MIYNSDREEVLNKIRLMMKDELNNLNFFNNITPSKLYASEEPKKKKL